MTYTHAIIYVGSPYGNNEQGHIHSRHTSLDLAEKRYERDFGGTTGHLNHRIVKLDGKGNWTR